MPTNTPKRRLSQAARRRIAHAQKLRWARWKENQQANMMNGASTPKATARRPPTSVRLDPDSFEKGFLRGFEIGRRGA